MSVKEATQDFVIEFKIIKMHSIDLGTGTIFQHPFKMREVTTPHTRLVKHGSDPTPHYVNKAIQPVFDLDHIFQVRLLDETVYVPVKVAGMSERLFQELEDKAFKDSMTAHERNGAVRKLIEHYVKEGVVEVVNDPFAREMVPYTEVPSGLPKDEPKTPVSDSAKSQKPAKPESSKSAE